jgi:hypothetical protein
VPKPHRAEPENALPMVVGADVENRVAPNSFEARADVPRTVAVETVKNPAVPELRGVEVTIVSHMVAAKDAKNPTAPNTHGAEANALHMVVDGYAKSPDATGQSRARANA